MSKEEREALKAQEKREKQLAKDSAKVRLAKLQDEAVLTQCTGRQRG